MSSFIDGGMDQMETLKSVTSEHTQNTSEQTINNTENEVKNECSTDNSATSDRNTVKLEDNRKEATANRTHQDAVMSNDDTIKPSNPEVNCTEVTGSRSENHLADFDTTKTAVVERNCIKDSSNISDEASDQKDGLLMEYREGSSTEDSSSSSESSDDESGPEIDKDNKSSR